MSKGFFMSKYILSLVLFLSFVPAYADSYLPTSQDDCIQLSSIVFSAFSSKGVVPLKKQYEQIEKYVDKEEQKQWKDLIKKIYTTKESPEKFTEKFYLSCLKSLPKGVSI
jgi:predicted KAP-like P-loop ATPase